MTIKSPYNFVPLSETVVFPNWADEVSHDIPFEDGISGKIDLTVTLQSDTYIRNGGNWSEADKKDDKSKCQKFFTAAVNGEKKYIIPGTSFKGMIRNVLEIASFGKMQKVNDDKYSIRDLHNTRYTGELTEKRGGIIYPKTKAGWLCLDEGSYEDEGGRKWQIIPCDYARIEQEELSPDFGRRGTKTLKETTEFKYEKFGEDKLEVTFQLDEKTEHDEHSCGTIYYKKVKKDTLNKPESEMKGILVFTGQPSNRITQAERNSNEKLKKQHPKHMEFVFYEYETSKKPRSITASQKENFIFINSDSNKKPLPEWEYWTRNEEPKDKNLKEKKGDGELKEGRKVPVFYLEDSEGNIKSFGLAMMYRLPYDNSVVQTIEHTSRDHFSFDAYEKYEDKNKDKDEDKDKNKNKDKWQPDLSDLIFGYSNKGKSLKGRVQFSHFVSVENTDKIQDAGLKETVLGGPKATFYPNYLEQPNPKAGYKMFWDKDAKISGWKRYPAQGIEASYPQPPVVNGKKNEDVATKLTPLPKGTVFEGFVRFFNLKPVELGALLWTLTWGGEKYCQHKIGMGKPLGLGRISIDILEKWNRETSEDLDLNDPVEQFKNYMTKEIADWETSEQITELKKMADIRFWSESTTSYPILDMNCKPAINEFNDAKTAMEKLERYSENADRHDVKVETLEDKMKKAEKDARIETASKGLTPELQEVFKSLCKLKKGDLKNKLKANDITAEERAVLKIQNQDAWVEKWQWEVIEEQRKRWDK